MPATVRDLESELVAVRRRLDEAAHYLRLEQLRARIADLEKELSRPNLWDDTEAGQRVTREYGQTKGDVDRLDTLQDQVADAETLYQLAVEEADDSVAAELEDMVGT